VAADIIGTWQLLDEAATEAGGRPLPRLYGAEPLGSVTFTAAGRFAAILSDGGQGQAPRAMTAFCGRYGPEGATLLLHAEASTNPAHLAEPQRREVVLDGERLQLVARAPNGATRIFTWGRLA